MILMMNRVVLVGRLTKEVDLKYTPNGVPVARFTLAVNRTFSNQNGEREADFINVLVWRRAAENCANFLKKGSLTGVDGRIQTSSFEGQDGKRVFMTEVVAESVQFLEPKNASGGAGNNSGGRTNENQTSGGNNQNYPRIDEDPFAGGGQIDIADEDLPF
jgi:single-strand DNA-binding protein